MEGELVAAGRGHGGIGMMKAGSVRGKDDGGDGFCGSAPVMALEDYVDVGWGRGVQTTCGFILDAFESGRLE